MLLVLDERGSLVDLGLPSHFTDDSSHASGSDFDHVDFNVLLPRNVRIVDEQQLAVSSGDPCLHRTTAKVGTGTRFVVWELESHGKLLTVRQGDSLTS